METMLDLGSVKVHWLNGGNFELDGGTMYGAVPKILWNKKYPADAENYIKILSAPLLLQTATKNIIIDTGIGNKLSDKQRQIFRVSQEWSIPENLASFGLSTADIDYVILTHGDFDHAGGVVMLSENGKPVLSFPNARHVIQQHEWHDVINPNIRSAHTYLRQNFTSLIESHLLDLTTGNREIVPGVTVRKTGGHTRGHQLVEIVGDKGCAVHLGDLLPTHTHTNPLWITAYDNFPMEVIQQKEKLISHYRSKNCWFTFYHDIYMKACRLEEDGKVIEKLG